MNIFFLYTFVNEILWIFNCVFDIFALYCLGKNTEITHRIRHHIGKIIYTQRMTF